MQARDALARHQPEPVTEPEVRLWMQLHIGEDIPAEDVRVMLDMASRQPDGELRDAIIGLVVREVLFTPDPKVAYPTEVIQRTTALSATVTNTPGSALSAVSGDEELRRLLERDQFDPVAFDAMISEVRGGITSLADVARAIDRPYGAGLLHRPAGLLVAADQEPGMRAAGEAAAQAAIAAGTCAADLSAVHLTNLVDAATRGQLRVALPEVVVSSSSVNDAIRTKDNVRGLAISTYTASLDSDGTLSRTRLTATQRAQLQEQSSDLARAVCGMTIRADPSREGPAAATITIARTEGLALWCDDTALRQRARGLGVPAFGTIDLASALAKNGIPLDEAQVRRDLAEHYVVDLPLVAEDIVTIARASAWSPGPVHTALSRGPWWRQHAQDWPEEWVVIARAARAHSAEAFTDIVRAGLTGGIAAVGTGFATQRYQELLVQSLVACHLAGLLRRMICSRCWPGTLPTVYHRGLHSCSRPSSRR